MHFAERNQGMVYIPFGLHPRANSVLFLFIYFNHLVLLFYTIFLLMFRFMSLCFLFQFGTISLKALLCAPKNLLVWHFGGLSFIRAPREQIKPQEPTRNVIQFAMNYEAHLASSSEGVQLYVQRQDWA
jgi:hypothetical protein